MDIKREAVRGVAWSTIQRGGTQVISFIVFAILSRLLDPDAFGLVALATVFIALIQIFLDQGFVSAIIQQEVIEEIHLDTAFWSSVGMGGMMTILAVVVSKFVAAIYHEPQLTRILQFLSISMLLLALGSTQRAVLTRELSFNKLAIWTLASEIAGGVVGIIFAFRGFGVWSLVGRNLVRDFIGLLVLWTVSGWRPRFSFSNSHFKELFRFGINVIGERLLYFVNRNLDRLLLGYFLGATVLGYYSVGIRLVELMIKLFFETVSFVAFPVFSRIQNDIVKMRNAFFRVIKLSGMLTFPAFAGISILSSDIIQALFGSKWEASIPILRIVSMSGIIYGITYLIPHILLAVGKPDWRFRIAFINTIIYIIAIFIGVHWGVIGVAFGIVVSYLSISPVLFWSINQIMKVQLVDYVQQFYPAIIGSAVMTVSILVMQSFISSFVSVEISLFIQIILGLTLYSLSIYIVDRHTLQEMVAIAGNLLPAKEKK